MRRRATAASSSPSSGSSCGQQRARDHDALYLARPFIDRGRASVAGVPLDGVVAHVPVAAEYLHRGVRGALCHLARVELGHRGFAGERPALVAEPGRAKREKARGREIAVGLGEPEAKSLEIRDRTAELLPLLRVRARDLERAPRDPHGLRRDADATAVEPGHRYAEALPGLAKQGVVADLGVIENERARVRCAKTVLALRRSDRDTGRVERHNESRDAGAGTFWIELADTREHDREGRVARVGDELLSPAEIGRAHV